MIILITGGQGFVGSHLAKRLKKRGHKIISIDNGIGGYPDNLEDIKNYNVDCCDQIKVNEIFNKYKFDIVIHSACTPYEGLSVVSPILITRNTFDATVNILTAAIKNKVKRFIYLSSMARYGSQKTPFTEEMKTAPEDPYGIAKVAAEQVVKCLCDANNIEWTITVPHNIYGPNQVYDDPYRNVVSIFLHRQLKKEPALIYGDGEQKRCFSYIDDTLQVFEQICFEKKSAGEIFNIGPDEDYISIKELADLCANITNFNGPHQFLPKRPNEVKYATCSSNKIRKFFNYKTETNIVEGIKNTLNFIKKRGVREFNYNLPIEIDNELTPKSWTKKLI